MNTNSPTDYKALFLQEQERRRQAEEEGRQEKERNRKTTLVEFLRCCHNVLSRPLQVRTPSDSTTGETPIPKGKYCPTRLERWVDCAARQQDIYNSVRHYLQPQENAPRLFPPRIVLDGLSEHFKGPMGAEYDLQTYERLAVEDHTRYIFLELCKIPAAREEFGLGDGVLFDSHPKILNDTEIVEKDTKNASATPRGKPDQLFIHRVDDRTTTLLTTAEYKPPHKLPLEDIHRGLRDMDLWKEIVWSNKVPNDEAESLVYNSQRLVCSAIVQEYHVMIQEGLEYSYLTTGIALVLLRVPYDKPSTLYYYLCEPNQEVGHEDGDLQSPSTAIARVLCLCLMSFCSQPRNQEWRNEYCRDLKVWTTQFDGLHETICSRELHQNPHSDDTNCVSPISPATSPEFLESSSPVGSPRAPARRVATISQGGCAPSDLRDLTESLDSLGSDSDYAVSRRKRGFSQVEVSPSQRPSRQNERQNEQDIQKDLSQRQRAQFCTQRCLLGLKNGGPLDDSCPNVHIHQQSGDGVQHPINAAKLVSCLKQQMDEIIDRCIPFGTIGSYSAPFKLTCSLYGYTVVGKGTSSYLWQQLVSREAEIYQILLKAQGSAVPVFFGKMDLAKIYFLHGAGEIRHMLVMGWAGESIANLEETAELHREFKRSNKEIRALGVRHLDPWPNNILWNAELGRALIIDFHRCELDRRPAAERTSSLKRRKV
ncbi:Protein kinase-like domain [Penicillium digitatum]|uniref:Protein kinase-like domain n=1 Tax=Penicillium digitatum TaxID=36651 RepID=A0A7T6XR65_PENDI|nr:Protein kinase-like domain [Penicillium digitatum]